MEIIQLKYNYKDGQRFPFLLASDLHIDEAGFDEALARQEFDDAVAEGAQILINGDVLGLILPKDFKRYAAGSDQFPGIDAKINAIVERAEAFLKPYANHIAMIGCGNHETAVLKHHAVDATRLLVLLLNRSRDPKLPPIRHGGYSGFIRFTFGHASGGHVQTYDLFYNHGQGGGGEVTDGIINLKRREYIASDLVWMGHVHKKWSGVIGEEQGLDRLGKLYTRTQRGVLTGTYLRNSGETNADRDGYRINYAEESMRRPQARGGAMLRLTARRTGITAKVEA